MMSPSTSSSTSSSFHPFSLLFVFLLFSQFVESVETKKERLSSVPAVFVFGDSTVDSGNNNYIPTAFRSNFPPYGKDYPNHIPTGRFTNGKLVTDFAASYIGIKHYIPPYLDPTLSLDDLMTGVSFASAGSGFDPLTSQQDGVISMEKQLNYFKECKLRIEMYAGKERADKLINEAIFLISAGSNDFIANYYGPIPIRRHTFNISAYQNFMLHLSKQFIQGLVEMGGRKIAFVGLPPMGCFPVAITIDSVQSLTDRLCVEQLSTTARDYNRLLKRNLAAIKGAATFYIDIYKPIDDMVKNPQQFGFDIVNRGCCGSGILEAGLLCNPYSPICSNDSTYVFWDSIHPTQTAYYYIFRFLRPIIDQIIHL